MIHNTGRANLKPQQLKYTPALAAKAAKLLQSGESLTATALAVKVSRASLRNWRDRDPKLNEAFGTFEANKAKAGQSVNGSSHGHELAGCARIEIPRTRTGFTRRRMGVGLAHEETPPVGDGCGVGWV